MAMAVCSNRSELVFGTDLHAAAMVRRVLARELVSWVVSVGARGEAVRAEVPRQPAADR
jgi:hypothetical protein